MAAVVPGTLRLVWPLAFQSAFAAVTRRKWLTRALERADAIELGRWLMGLTALCFMALVAEWLQYRQGVGEDVSAAGDVISEPFPDDNEDAEPGG